MADAWKPGDLALCIGAKGELAWTQTAGPDLWSTSTVREVEPDPLGTLHLSFKEWPPLHFYDAREFIRTTDLTEDERKQAAADLFVADFEEAFLADGGQKARGQ